MAKFYICALGCKVNSYEIDAIKSDLLANNHQYVNEKEADVIIVNTCCVTNTAASKSRQKINSIHKNNPNADIIVMGCYVQGFEQEAKNILGVKLLVGTKDRSKIKDYINDLQTQVSLVSDVKDYNVYEDLAMASSCENTRAYLKIQDGCNNFCSYCIIPYVRGQIKSRDKNEVIKEAKHLLSLGFKEIVLTGIHTGSYGKDLDGYPFSSLVEDLLKLDGLYRLRISSIEESEIDDKLVSLLVNNEKLAKHLHIPLQAGSDHVLKLMNRKYDLKTFINNVLAIKEKVKDIAITSDVIVGFPDESEENFIDTLNTCKTLEFAKIHVFPYSSRKGTVASKMKNQIDGNIKKDRAKRLLSLSNELNYNYNKKFENKELEVLIEEFNKGYYVGHSCNFIKVLIETNKKLNSNDIVKVDVLKAYDSYVLAKIKGE